MWRVGLGGQSAVLSLGAWLHRALAGGHLFRVPALCMCVGELSPGWILSQPRAPWVEEACMAQESGVPGSSVGRGPGLMLGVLTK